MHLSKNFFFFFKQRGLSSFIDFLDLPPHPPTRLSAANNSATATKMCSFEMNGFISRLIPKMPFDIIIKD